MCRLPRLTGWKEIPAKILRGHEVSYRFFGIKMGVVAGKSCKTLQNVAKLCIFYTKRCQTCAKRSKTYTKCCQILLFFTFFCTALKTATKTPRHEEKRNHEWTRTDPPTGVEERMDEGQGRTDDRPAYAEATARQATEDGQKEGYLGNRKSGN